MKNSRGFTLLEVLVAMAVLGLLVVLSAQIVSQTILTSGAVRKRAAAMQGARQVLEVANNDLSQIAVGRGAVLAVRSATGDALAFLTTGRPLEAGGEVSDVRFTPVFLGVENRAPVDLQSAAAIPMVVRGLGRSPWTNGSRGLADAVARAAAGELEWREPLWEGAFRMEVVFLTAEGQITPNPPLLAGFASSPPLPPGWYPVDPAGLRGLVVAVAVLDKETLSLALSIDPGIMQRLADSLPSVSADNITPVQSWSFDMFPGDIPEPIRQHVRFFERTYYLSGVPAL